MSTADITSSTDRHRGGHPVTDDQGALARGHPTTLVETLIRLGILGLLLYWSFTLVQPFISIVIWSAVLAVALYPVYHWIAEQLGGRRRLAAVLMTALNLVLVIGPATWLASGLIDGVHMLAEKLDPSVFAIPAPPASIKSWPVIGDPIFQFWSLASTNFSGALAMIAPQLKPFGATLLGIGAETGISVFKFLASIIVAGFLFSPGPTIVEAVKAFAHRLNAERGEHFIELAGATIRAVSRGVIGISVLQALLAGIGLSAAGIPQASLITFAVLVLGIVQIGSAIVLLPVMVWSWTALGPTTAIVFSVYIVLVGLLDNALKPFVMGRGLQVPMLVILIGVVGGALGYGITGVFLGPIILAVIWELLVAWIAEDHPARA
jgi:predicted PurR-regulated permease PerM